MFTHKTIALSLFSVFLCIIMMGFGAVKPANAVNCDYYDGNKCSYMCLGQQAGYQFNASYNNNNLNDLCYTSSMGTPPYSSIGNENFKCCIVSSQTVGTTVTYTCRAVPPGTICNTTGTGGGGTPGNPTPTPSSGGGGWGNCGCFGSGECVNKPNNEGVTHPSNECQMSPNGYCVWNPGLCAPTSGGGGGGGGGTTRPVCGQTCLNVGDCATGATGATTTCWDGVCVNLACPYNTVAGANCDCSGVVPKCGDPCGPGTAASDCTTGDPNLYCSYTNVPDYIGTDGTRYTYGLCWDPRRSTINIAPTNPAYYLRCVGRKNPYIGIAQCAGGDSDTDNFLVKPDGGSIFTMTEILTTCTSTAMAPVCMNITSSIVSPRVGDAVSFTCGMITGATRYEFRYEIVKPDSSVLGPYGIPTLTTTNVSLPIPISNLGTYKAQCRPCSESGCADFEPF